MSRPPHEFRGFIGQKKVVDQLRGQLAGAIALGEPFPHVGFFGPSGVGKTKLAEVLAAERGTRLHRISGHADPEKHVAEFKRVESCDVYLVDEAHGLKPACQELLLHVVDYLKIPESDGERLLPGAAGGEDDDRRVQPFTLILATDRPGHLINPLHRRLEIQVLLALYSIEELKAIVDRMATDFDMLISPQGARLVAQVSSGLPRRVKHHLGNLRRLFPDVSAKQLSTDHVRKLLVEFQIDAKGLGPRECEYLSYLREMGSASLESLALELGLDSVFVRQQIEPLLQHHRFITISAGGRKLTDAGSDWIDGKQQPPDDQGIEI